MIRGLYTAYLGMNTQMNKMDVVTNNIANVNTTSYKRDGVITQTFSEELTKRINDPKDKLIDSSRNVGSLTMGLAVDNIYTDFSEGSLQKTDGPLDLTISGKGFFVISTTDNTGNAVERYTRDGSFTMTATGTLVTRDGDLVTGNNGVIRIPNGEISIDSKGNIFSNGEYVDTLMIVDFEDRTTLRKFGSNLYDATDASVPAAFNGTVLQGFLEGSNVNSVKEMVEMISLSRNYEASQKVITTLDDVLSKAVNEVGKK